MHFAFDTRNVYYLPQYAPVLQELCRRGHEGSFTCYSNKNSRDDFSSVFDALNAPVHWFGSGEEAASHYASLRPEWIVFGSGFQHLDKLDAHTQPAQLGHGIGPKPSYYKKPPMSGGSAVEPLPDRAGSGPFATVGATSHNFCSQARLGQASQPATIVLTSVLTRVLTSVLTRVLTRI